MENFGFSENDAYLLNATYQDDGSHHIVFAIEKQMADKIMKSYYKARKKLFKVNGFRKGNAPVTLVEKMMGGKTGMYGPTFSTYANIKVMEKSPHKVIHTYNFDVKEVEDGWEVIFDAQFEAPASIKDEDLVMEFDIPKLEVNNYVDYRLRAFSRMNPILKIKGSDEAEDTPAADEDDMVEVSIEAFLDGKRFEDGSHDATNIRLVEGGVKPESLYKKLLGSMPGDVFEIGVTNPDEVPSSFSGDFVGKKDLLINVKINHVFTCEDPDVDDELAITAGYNTFEEWRAALVESATRINKGRDDQLKRTLILDHIVDTIEYPDFSEAWANEKADELADKGDHENTPVVRDELKKIAKQHVLLKHIGEYLDIEWDEGEEDKSKYERNEQGYAEKVLIYLIGSKAKWKYVDTRTEGDSREDRGDEEQQPGSTSSDRERMGAELQDKV